MVKKKDIIVEEKRIKKEWKNILFNSLFAFATVAFVGLFYKNIILTFILVGLVALIGLIKWKSWITLIVFIFGALWGPASEMFCIAFGAWNYPIINVFTIPLWLFIVWGNAAAFLYQIALEIKKLGVKK